MKVLALHLAKAGEYPTACQIYRTNIPFAELSKRGWIAAWDYIDRLVEDYKTRGRQAWVDLALGYDLVVLPRACAPTEKHLESVAALIELFHRLGKPVVYEVDDDFTNEHRDLTNMGINNAMQVASLCDAVTVTTPYLADVMRRRTRRPVHVLPNCIDPAAWVRNLRENEGLTIGLSGSSTHEGDWKVLATVLPDILNRYDVRLMIAAYHPEYLQGLPNTTYLPGMDYLSYAEFVRRCDIVLCPVDPDDGFNASKSPIKAIEGQAAGRIVNGQTAGAAVLATDNLVYRLAITHEKTGLLTAHTPEGWSESLSRLITDTALRQRLQIAGHKAVLKRYDIRKEWVRWARAYRHITSKYRPLGKDSRYVRSQPTVNL